MQRNVQNDGRDATLGRRLREIWLASGMRQGEFAAACGVSASSLRNYFEDSRKPDSDFLVRVVNSFEIRADWLLLGLGPMREGDKTAVMPNEHGINRDTLTDVIIATIEALDDRYVTTPAGKVAELIFLLTEYCKSEIDYRNSNIIERFLRLMQ